MICPKCGYNCIKEKDARVISLGMETIKGTLKIGYWSFKIASSLTENFGHPGKLASMVARGIGGAIDAGAENINTEVRKCHCPKCNHNWYIFYK